MVIGVVWRGKHRRTRVFFDRILRKVKRKESRRPRQPPRLQTHWVGVRNKSSTLVKTVPQTAVCLLHTVSKQSQYAVKQTRQPDRNLTSSNTQHHNHKVRGGGGVWTQPSQRQQSKNFRFHLATLIFTFLLAKLVNINVWPILKPFSNAVTILQV